MSTQNLQRSTSQESNALSSVERLEVTCSPESDQWAMSQRFIARGIIGDQGGNAARIGRFTFLAKAGIDWYQWDGAHKAAQFGTPGAALAAAAACPGPWFNLPTPGSIEVVRFCATTVLDSMRARMERAKWEGVPPRRFLDNEIASGASLRQSARAAARDIGLATQHAAGVLLVEIFGEVGDASRRDSYTR